MTDERPRPRAALAAVRAPKNRKSDDRRDERERDADRSLQLVRRAKPGDDAGKREQRGDEQPAARDDDLAGATGVGEFGLLLGPEDPAKFSGRSRVGQSEPLH